MIIETSATACGQEKLDKLSLGNQMQAKAWNLYRETKDERFARRAEWWQRETERAIGRINEG